MTALTHVKLVTINKAKYLQLNREYNDVFSEIFAPHKRDTSDGREALHHVPRSRGGRPDALSKLKKRTSTHHKSAMNLMPHHNF